MGEVFRADDLKLGQEVALKFLPPDVDRDPARLTQLHTEVRMARQVSHPNVCRVYDIDDVEGHTFLSMEYVDGEDLASLLRRIGRFPQERALEIARQICAGLNAAHERGVVHRDFKPANVMIDGTGKVRVTDFGLAGMSGESVRAGTPAYMAPEQIGGGEVTPRSDIYALGLVLYEVFTGQRALEGRNLAELIRRREQNGIVPPTEIVRDLAPDIESGIMRCLRPDPESRPATALAVAASLPGGDPLAAALAAGETPSPEMVAAAGMTDVVSARHALLGAAWIALGLLVIVLMYQRVLLVNRVPIPKPADALADRAQEAVARLGYPGPYRATASGMTVSTDYLNYVAQTNSTAARWKDLRSLRPESVIYWQRTSPRLLIPFGRDNDVHGTNPPLNVSGMTLAVVDASGRLAEFHAVPEPIESPEAHGPPNWKTLFDVASLEMGTFQPVKPEWIPLVYADERSAWEGPLPERPDLKVRVEAAAYHGRIVYFGMTGPWTRSNRSEPAAASRFNQILGSIAGLVMPALLLTGAILARYNFRLERGDRVGAIRAATITFAISMFVWATGGTHVASLGVEIDRFFAGVRSGLYNGAVLWVTYLGLEPYVRRTAPDSLIGWRRLIGGSWNDPHVGKDLIAGVSAGVLMTLFFPLYYLLPPIAGYPEPIPVLPDLRPLLGFRFVLSALATHLLNAISSGMLGTIGVIALVMLLKRRWLAITVAIICFTPVVVDGMFSAGYPTLALALGAAIITVFIFVVLHDGLLAGITALTTHFFLMTAPTTLDFSNWWAPVGLWYIGSVALIGLGGCYLARSGRTWKPERAYSLQRA